MPDGEIVRLIRSEHIKFIMLLIMTLCGEKTLTPFCQREIVYLIPLTHREVQW
jgi:hypothetical protein